MARGSLFLEPSPVSSSTISSPTDPSSFPRCCARISAPIASASSAMRRGAPEFLVGLLLAILLASYVVYTQRVVRELRREALRSSQMYARVFRAQSDTAEAAGTQALLDVSKTIVAQGGPAHRQRQPATRSGWRRSTHSRIPEGAGSPEPASR